MGDQVALAGALVLLVGARGDGQVAVVGGEHAGDCGGVGAIAVAVGAVLAEGGLLGGQPDQQLQAGAAALRGVAGGLGVGGLQQLDVATGGDVDVLVGQDLGGLD